MYSFRCCLAALVRFGWSNLGLNDVLLGRRSFEVDSSTLKVKREKKVKEKQLLMDHVLEQR
jgi:hypothetical protein